MDERDQHSEVRRGVVAVARALDVLRALGDADEDLTLVQIADEVGLPRSTVHRLVQTLQAANFVAAHGRRGGFTLGPELVRLAALSQTQLVRLVRPYLELLSHQLNEGSSVAVLEGANVRFLDQYIAGQGLRAVSLIGATFPAYCTANGKALLAALPRPALMATLPKRLDRLTEHTIISHEELLAELNAVRSTGIAYDREEHTLGICAVGAAIEDATGRMAAITVALPAERFYQHEARVTDALQETVIQIRHALAGSTDAGAGV